MNYRSHWPTSYTYAPLMKYLLTSGVWYFFSLLSFKDDPLSSLDNEVARHIFEQSIKKMLLKANRTVILVTQQLNLVQQAHNVSIQTIRAILCWPSVKYFLFRLVCKHDTFNCQNDTENARGITNKREKNRTEDIFVTRPEGVDDRYWQINHRKIFFNLRTIHFEYFVLNVRECYTFFVFSSFSLPLLSCFFLSFKIYYRIAIIFVLYYTISKK